MYTAFLLNIAMCLQQGHAETFRKALIKSKRGHMDEDVKHQLQYNLPNYGSQ